jgi:hypothetical protein
MQSWMFGLHGCAGFSRALFPGLFLCACTSGSTAEFCCFQCCCFAPCTPTVTLCPLHSALCTVHCVASLFETAHFEQFLLFKTAHFEQFSLFETAHFEQFSFFETAHFEHFERFEHTAYFHFQHFTLHTAYCIPFDCFTLHTSTLNTSHFETAHFEHFERFKHTAYFHFQHSTLHTAYFLITSHCILPLWTLHT